MATTNPQRIRVDNRRKEQSKWRQRKLWKNLVKEHAHIPGVVCEHCGHKHNEPKLDKKGNVRKNKNGSIKQYCLTINHLNRALYETEELYCTWNEIEMEICCTTCNWMFESGQKPCPVCKRTYIHWRDFTCQACWDISHPIEAKNRLERASQKASDKKALLKALRDKEKAKNKAWKNEHKNHLPEKREVSKPDTQVQSKTIAPIKTAK
jgi:hypothetical protein